MNIAILISTRNRPVQLDALLQSICWLHSQPVQVVISSSGEDVKNVVTKYVDRLKINHVHTDLYGQIRQKMLGIATLKNTVQWTLFLDDDVLLAQDTLTQLQATIESESKNTAKKLLGIGLSTPNTSHLKDRSSLERMIAKIFLLDSSKPGVILTSGHPVSYQDSVQIIRTEWLNGISAWDSSALSHYGSDYLDSRYSALEDVFFSYSQSKVGDLIYDPKIKISFQEETQTNLAKLSIFESVSYWRLKLVLSDKQFSKTGFFWSQIGRSIFFIHSPVGSLSILLRKLFKLSQILFEILFQIAIKKNPNWSLERHCRD